MTRTRGFTGGAWAIAVAQLILLLATSTRYGYHRDELYFIVAGHHPAFGYPDQPPLVPLICAAMDSLAHGSLLMLRTPSALVAAATTLLSAAIAREVGGGGRAQVIAAACAAVSGFALAVGHFVTTTTFDLLSTTLLGWLAVRIVLRERPRDLLAAGIVVGLGIEAKPQVGLVAAVMAAALVAVGPRRVLRNRWAVLGALAAAALAAPYLVWQAAHGWPQQQVAANIAGSAEGGRAGFIPFQLIMVSPLLVGVWLAGLMAPYRRAGWRELRFVPVTYLAMAVLYLIGNGKAYYLASLYPLLLGLGAIPVSDWLDRARWRPAGLTAAVLLSGLFSALIALPLVPERQLQGSAVIALNRDQGETVGWPQFVATVHAAWARVPAAERGSTAIFASNYGEAGALTVLTSGLPHIYSAHNGFSEWGEPPAADTHVLLAGASRGATGPFAHCSVLARVWNGVGLNNDEQGGPVLFCAVAGRWPALWASLTHFD